MADVPPLVAGQVYGAGRFPASAADAKLAAAEIGEETPWQ
jgi:hypothetical protein